MIMINIYGNMLYIINIDQMTIRFKKIIINQISNALLNKVFARVMLHGVRGLKYEKLFNSIGIREAFIEL